MKSIKIATSLFILNSFSAFAADLPSIKSAPIAAPSKLYNWSGLYGGVNVGYGFGANNCDWGSTWAPQANVATWGSPSMVQTNIAGVLGGGQLGYNYQWNSNLILGVEADIQASDVNGSAYGLKKAISGNAIGQANQYSAIDWFGTARGRIGFTLPAYSNFLIYGTGGFAYGYINDTNSKATLVFNPLGNGASGVATYGNTKSGWTAGGGIEWSPQTFSAWSAKIEYLYTDLGSVVQTIPTTYTSGGPIYTTIWRHSTPYQFNSIRVGLNWHFNPFVGEPIVAKY